MPRRSAKPYGLMPVECLWEEVFTGLTSPERLTKGEKAALRPEIVAELIRAGACRGV